MTETQVKERGILFSPDMVRALLEGMKTQTRRIVKGHVITTDDRNGATDCLCPHGAVGDRLWVRENWWLHLGAFGYQVVRYCASEKSWPRARPSIHMPRWASRITLEITDVRVERLQDITEADAIAEGLFANGFAAGVCHPHAQENCRRCGYRLLWESINGAGSWDANPWVWAISFRRLP